VSRWGLLLAIIISIYVLIYFYPEKRKLILTSGLFIIVFAIAVGSMMKIWAMGEWNASVWDAVEKYLTPEYFDEYFSGIVPVANGLQLVKYYSGDVNFLNAVSDVFYEFPYAIKILGISEYVTNYMFQRFTGHYDLIMPTIIQAKLVFGSILAPFYSATLTLLAMWSGRKVKGSSSLYKRIFYLTITFWCSLFMAVNVNIIQSNVWYAVIGLLLISMEEKLRLKLR
ncbi:hypothetical protein J9303_20255, partial [Bacillaceae bacterium Marseille-Q3522]|nr:hypothetical protein [Bacillaceae bacterium Marseille-Q3522]